MDTLPQSTMLADDASVEHGGLPDELLILRTAGEPVGYPPPTGCRLGATAPRSVDLGIALLIANSDAPMITTDDTPEIAAIVDAIDQNPHLFAERYLQLERRVERLEQRLSLLHGAIR